MKFTDFCREHHIAHVTSGEHHHTRDGWVQIDCPFCGSGSGKYHMGYSMAHAYFHCWRCGPQKTGDVIAELIPGKTSGAAYHLFNNAVDKDHTRATKRKAVGKLKTPKGIKPMGVRHRRYLKSRGFNPTTIEKLWHVQGIGLHSTLAWRLWIPFHHLGEVVSWTTRTISKNNSYKYINASLEQEKYRSAELLYGEDYCRHAIVVCEGPTDAWRIGPGAVATTGIGFIGEQVDRVSRYNKRLICFDAEPAAQKRAERLCKMLEVMPGETFNIQLDSGDPGDATKREVKQIRKAAFGE
jgi:hypothetical protein